MNSVYNTLRLLLKTLIYSRVWIAVCTFCFAQSSVLLFTGSTGVEDYSVFLALGSYLLYVLPFIYYGLKRQKRASNPRQLWVEKTPGRLYLTAVAVGFALLVSAWFYFDLFLRIIGFGWLVFVLTVLYELPLIPYKGRFFALRQAGIAKPFLLAFVWWYLGAYLIAKRFMVDWSCFPHHITLPELYLLAFQFVFVLVLCIMFDIRDYDNDKLNKIKTWPVRLGINNTKKVLVAVCIIALAAVFISPIALSMQLTYVVLFGLLVYFNLRKTEKTPWEFYDLAVDGLMVLQWGLVWVATTLL